MPTKVFLSVYLILEKGDKVLLGLRQNTGYMDGRWSFVAGHVESEERAKAALVREVKEEIGIDIKEEDLEVVHIMHRNTNRENIDIFMKLSNFTGEIKNLEPEKCKDLQFFSKKVLPQNIVSYNKYVLSMIDRDVIYSEYDW